MTNIDDMQLQQIAASMLIDCNREVFDDIHEAFEKIMANMLTMIEKCGIEYNLRDVEHSVIDSIAVGLKLTLSKRDIGE